MADHPITAAAANGRENELLTAHQVAEILGMGVDWVYAQARAGKLKAVKLGRYRRFRRKAVEEFIEHMERA